MNKKVLLINQLQELFDKQFNKYLGVKVNGISIFVMPLKGDVPIIESCDFNKDVDCLIIKFRTPLNIGHENVPETPIVTYIKNSNNNVSGLQINGINHIKLPISTLHVNKLKELKSNEDVKEYSFKRRTFDFTKDLLTSKEIKNNLVLAN